MTKKKEEPTPTSARDALKVLEAEVERLEKSCALAEGKVEEAKGTKRQAVLMDEAPARIRALRTAVVEAESDLDDAHTRLGALAEKIGPAKALADAEEAAEVDARLLGIEARLDAQLRGPVKTAAEALGRTAEVADVLFKERDALAVAAGRSRLFYAYVPNVVSAFVAESGAIPRHAFKTPGDVLKRLGRLLTEAPAPASEGSAILAEPEAAPDAPTPDDWDLGEAEAANV